MNYQNWVFTFDNLIGSKPCSSTDKLHYLKRLVKKAALKVVEGYSFLQSEDAYEMARALLKRCFGDEYMISKAFRTTLEDWPKIKQADSEGLRRLSDFLYQCRAAQKSIKQLTILDDNRENKKLLS